MSNVVDRRKFLTYTGAAGAATGAAWIAPSVLGSSTAFAAGSQSDCVDSQTLHWTNFTSMGYESPNATGTVTFSVKVPAVGANPDVWVKVTVTAFSSPLPATGPAVNPARFPAPGDNNGALPSPTTGGINANSNGFNGYTSFYELCMKCTTQAGYTMRFDFYRDAALSQSVNVFNLGFKIIDIDRQTPSNPYNDKVFLSDTSFTAVKGSQVSGAGTSIDPWVGTATGGVTNDTGTVTVTYAGPINTFSFTYQAHEFTSGFNQYIAIGDLTWC